VSALVWISGASSGIGRALAATVPWDGARVIGISRGRPGGAVEHLALDLADPAAWPLVGASFREELAGSDPDRVVFVHAAGTLAPMGFAAEVDSAAYQASVLLNSASPQVLGQLFLAAAAPLSARGNLVVISSGAASSVYPGWTAYGAGKAAVDQWVRNAGAEQDRRGGVQVLAVAPGTVDTGMQEQMRNTPEADFPSRQKFQDLYDQGKLSDPHDVATRIWGLLDRDMDNGSVVDLRKLG
jgi:benzil reductase ((S)-benzoin forming)